MEDPRIISTQFNSPKMPHYNVLVNTEKGALNFWKAFTIALEYSRTFLRK